MPTSCWCVVHLSAECFRILYVSFDLHPFDFFYAGIKILFLEPFTSEVAVNKTRQAATKKQAGVGKKL